MMLSQTQPTLITWTCLFQNRVIFISPFSDLNVLIFLQFSQRKISTVLSAGRGFGALFSVDQLTENIAAAILEFQAYFISERAWHCKEKTFVCQLISVKCNFINQCKRGQQICSKT
jgi:hypothetical protein